jgi:hypothetical protein
MFMTFEDRSSDSPLIERVWRCRGNGGGSFLSVAAAHPELVVTRIADMTMATLRGPETQATPIVCPPNGEWVAIRFRLGVYFPGLATRRLLDRQDLNLPVRGDDSFWLADSFWNCRISRPPRQGRCEEAIDFYRDAVDADATVVARVGDLPGPPAPPGALTGRRPFSAATAPPRNRSVAAPSDRGRQARNGLSAKRLTAAGRSAARHR